MAEQEQPKKSSLRPFSAWLRGGDADDSPGVDDLATQVDAAHDQPGAATTAHITTVGNTPSSPTTPGPPPTPTTAVPPLSNSPTSPITDTIPTTPAPNVPQLGLSQPGSPSQDLSLSPDPNLTPPGSPPFGSRPELGGSTRGLRSLTSDAGSGVTTLDQAPSAQYGDLGLARILGRTSNQLPLAEGSGSGIVSSSVDTHSTPPRQGPAAHGVPAIYQHEPPGGQSDLAGSRIHTNGGGHGSTDSGLELPADEGGDQQGIGGQDVQQVQPTTERDRAQQAQQAPGGRGRRVIRVVRKLLRQAGDRIKRSIR